MIEIDLRFRESRNQMAKYLIMSGRAMVLIGIALLIISYFN